MAGARSNEDLGLGVTGGGSPGGDPGADRLSREHRTASLMEALSAVEDRLDPLPARRGQLIADVMTLAAIGIAVVVTGFPIERPLLLVALLVLGAGATRSIRHVWLYRLRRERERLLEELEGPPSAGTG